MNVLFDIDGTITREAEFMVKYAPKYLKKKFNTDFKVVNENGYSVSEVFGVDVFLIQLGYDAKEVEEKTKEINSGFWNKNFIKYMFYPIKSDTKKIIDDLKEKDSKIIFASLRGKPTKDNETYKDIFIRTKIVPFLTKMQLKINHIAYDDVILVEDNMEKIYIAQEKSVKMVFDDNVQVLENVDKNMIPVCIKEPHNELVQFKNENVVRISLEYEEVSRLVKEKGLLKRNNSYKDKLKSLTIYQKLGTEIMYKIVRNIGKGFVLKKYNPFIIGEENLPKEKGANVFIGNHRNIKDPLITMISLKNPTHFAALKRMFEYNENMFGTVGKNMGTLVTTLFVKSMGALPVARPTDTNYIMTNLQTFKYVEEYLENNSSFAIYPEGTLNRTPEKDGNILSLKSDYAFKIAENGKAVVRPVAVVWVPDEIDIENRVFIAYLKPIHTENMKASQIRKAWDEAMNNAIDTINQMIKELGNITDYSSIEKVKTKKSNEIKRQ